MLSVGEGARSPESVCVTARMTFEESQLNKNRTIEMAKTEAMQLIPRTSDQLEYGVNKLTRAKEITQTE